MTRKPDHTDAPREPAEPQDPAPDCRELLRFTRERLRASMVEATSSEGRD